MNLDEASKLANSVIETLRPYCVRCEIAGSVRRKKLDGIKDIEVVLIPRNDSLPILRNLINSTWGKPIIGAWPAKYTKIRGLHAIDVFTANKTNWGLLFFIRTGPAEYVRRALAQWKELTPGGYSQDAILRMKDGGGVMTFEEVDVFRALQWDYCEPEKRI